MLVIGAAEIRSKMKVALDEAYLGVDVFILRQGDMFKLEYIPMSKIKITINKTLKPKKAGVKNE